MGDVEQEPTETEATEPAETEAPETEQPETPEAETPETPPEEVEAKEGEEAETKPAGEPEEPKAEEKHKRVGGWQRRIEKLERENSQLVQKLLSHQPATAPPASDKPKDPAAQMEEYVNNLVEQRLTAREAQGKQAQAQAEFQRRTAEVRAANPDFEEVLMSADVPVSAALQQVLLTSEQGPAIMYQLAKNPAELARISALPPLDAAREVGRLEAKASFTPSPKAPQKPATRPPAPPTTVGGSPSSTRSLDDLPLSAYKKAMRSGGR